MKIYPKLMFLALVVSTTTSAHNLTCPSTVKQGTSLVVSAVVVNQDCNNPIDVQDTVVSLVGNSGGGIGLQGPFVSPYSLIVPAASCKQVGQDPYCGPKGNSYCYYNTVVTEATHTISNLQVISKVPASMAGTLIAVSAGYLNNKNQLKAVGICNITVTQ